METAPVSLDDKYRLHGAQRALLNGRQALVRLLLEQRERDRHAGLVTAGFVTGYRGSPLGGFDTELSRAEALLSANDIIFQPGLNEDLALTAIAGTQQLAYLPDPKVDGVFGLWYAKGPGVDRSGDAIRHANLAGVSEKGGVLLVFGDDHAGKSSTTAHQSDVTLASWEVPILYPANLAEVLDYGLAGFAMSRFSGALVGLKLVNETAESTAVLELGIHRGFQLPDVQPSKSGVHLRSEVRAMQQQDTRLLYEKLPRAQMFARVNRLDRIAYGSDTPRFLIAAAGKAFADVIAALEALEISEEDARAAGIGVYKIALIFPLDPVPLSNAARDAVEILFIEEKRAQCEVQARNLLYNAPRRPVVSGKTNPDGSPGLAADRPLDMLDVALYVAARLEAALPGIAESLPQLSASVAALRCRAVPPAPPIAARRPGFCPGCPHNNSTKVPENSFGATGIGCHGMVMFHPDRRPLPMGQMGGEGANWIGLAPFTGTGHIFQNLGDGTYSHSGSLAIRAAVAAGINITYKILFNDAVAMTGGQPVEGALTIGRIVRQVAAEGVTRIVVLSEDPHRLARVDPLPAGIELRHRDHLSLVQEELRHHPGTSVLIYDQVCAAEKRRRRKINAFPNPDLRVFINSDVCEGCGDCSVQSNCLAIQPVETELGRKRRIDQSACNKDFSCVKGFCPSFVMVRGGRPRKAPIITQTAPALTDPALPAFGESFDMIVAGIGGTGVVTIGALIGMAARMEGRGVNLYDMTGLSQKGGAVFSHIRLRREPSVIVPARLGPGEADLALACDLVAGVHPEVTNTIARGRTSVIANRDTVATADFQTHPDFRIPGEAMAARLNEFSGGAFTSLQASSISEALLGDTIGANMVAFGFAWQRGTIPLRLESIEAAIRLNGRDVEANLRAFSAGRHAALADGSSADRPSTEAPETLADFVARRTADLQSYWSAAYAARYKRLMRDIMAAAAGIAGGDAFAWAAARSAYKLMAYKDEYEVARLYSDGRFKKALEREFDGSRDIRILLSPPLIARRDPATGRPRKISFGPWILPVFRLLSAFRWLRESPFDPFGSTRERRIERALRDAFLGAMTRTAQGLSNETLPEAIALAEAPLDVRGFGSIKLPAAERLLDRLNSQNLLGNSNSGISARRGGKRMTT